jgi:enoyl-[acyl-carrier protein] reductase II
VAELGEYSEMQTDKPFGVNVPMLYPNIEEIIQIILEEGLKIVLLQPGIRKHIQKPFRKKE